MAVNPSFSGALSGLARALVQHGRLQQGIAEELSVQARNSATGFIEQLVAKGRMSTLELAEFASQIFGPDTLTVLAAVGDAIWRTPRRR